MDASQALGRIREVSAQIGVDLPPGAGEQLLAWLEALLQENERLNLTAATTLERALGLLCLPSLLVGASWTEGAAAPKWIADLGSGNGFPGIAARSLWPQARLVLVDRRHRKAAALERIAVRLNLSGVEVLPLDAKGLGRARPDLGGKFHLVTLRAVTTLPEGVELAAPLLAPAGRVVQFQGPEPDAQEEALADRHAQSRGLLRRPDVVAADVLRARLVVHEKAP